MRDPLGQLQHYLTSCCSETTQRLQPWRTGGKGFQFRGQQVTENTPIVKAFKIRPSGWSPSIYADYISHEPQQPLEEKLQPGVLNSLVLVQHLKSEVLKF